MTRQTFYSLRTDGDQYRITKIVDGEPESSYLTTDRECDCPAGHRHTCRHRQMLPQMLAHHLCNTHWFFDFDGGGRIVDFNGTPKHLIEQLERSRTQEETSQETVSIPVDLAEEIVLVPAGQHVEVVSEAVEINPHKRSAQPWRRL